MKTQQQYSDKQKEAIEAYESHKHNEMAAAKSIGIDVKALRGRLWSAAKLGWPVTPDRYIEQAPVGFGLAKSTLQINAAGDVIQRWDRVFPMVNDLTVEYFNQRIPAARPIRCPKPANNKLMLEWPIADLHLGMLAWQQETGADYDNKIARALMVAAASKIFSMYGSVEEVVIAWLGDNQHADNRQNRTEKSGHVLDVDSRYPKTAEMIYEIGTTAIDMALQMSKTVRVVVVPGNHDPMSAIHFYMILAAHYRNEPRVIVDTSPAKHKFYRWGSNFFMASHGDTGGKRLASYMMQHVIRNNLTGIERMYVRAGHLHKRGRNCPPGLEEEDGVIVEHFPTLASRDAWSTEEAFVNQRATVANLWHKDYGRRSMTELCIKELLEVDKLAA